MVRAITVEYVYRTDVVAKEGTLVVSTARIE